MKIIVTTSNNYHHILPVFFYLYKKYWNEPFELVGYDKPKCQLPDNCTWVSMGKQGDNNEWSTDLRKYFEQQPQWFVWLMEDTFLKEFIDVNRLKMWVGYCFDKTGRIDLTNDMVKRPHLPLYHGTAFRDNISVALSDTKYRQSTQPSIWNKQFLLQYLIPSINPWDFETQPTQDEYWVLGSSLSSIVHNEGVRRYDIHKFNLDGMCQEDIDHIKTLITW